MLYTYRCPDGHLSEASHSMSEFNDRDNMEPRRNKCHCNLTGSLVIIHAPKFAIDFVGDATRGGGFNYGAGQYFKNNYERHEWMKRQEKAVVDPRTGKETVSTVEEVYPETVIKEKAFLKDCREAAASGAPAPVHPDVVERKRKMNEAAKERIVKNREQVAHYLATTG